MTSRKYLIRLFREIVGQMRRPAGGVSILAMTTQVEDVGAAVADPFQSYAPQPNHYDELFGPGDVIRPHWKVFADLFRALPVERQMSRVGRLNRLVRENGIADDIFADLTKTHDPWKIDLFPVIFSTSEWAWLERAVTQRARLFDAILGDIYGPQELLRTGAIPPLMILNDAAYLRPCREMGCGAGQLDFYAVDLARSPGGTWRVLDNHAETPAGSGFALANRVVHSQVAGDIFRAVNGLRLAPFYQKLQAELMSRVNRDDPLIALLTPGPRHEDYFGHAYLARYLGLVLMEGGDMRTVGNRVYMKTLEGLKLVDLIVRCVEGGSADALELNPNGFLGPVGLMQAVRKTPNLVTNMLGSAIIENRGLGRYLPSLSKQLLGEELELQDAPRWWLGDEAGRAHVFANFNRMIIRRAREGTGRPGGAELGRNPAKLSQEQAAALRSDIQLNGRALVAEEPVGFATTPSWTPAGLKPAPYAVRLFVARFGDSYHVMPGGIALTVDAQTGVSLSASEGQTRDVWVTSATEVSNHVSLMRPPIEGSGVQRAGKGLRSRAADNLFWLGRYTERADSTMRLMRAALTRMRDEGAESQAGEAVRKSLAAILAKGYAARKTPPAKEPLKAVESLVVTLMSSTDRAYSLPSTLESAHRVASVLRDRLSVEAWNTLQTFQTNPVWRGEITPGGIADIIDTLDQGVLTLAAFNGMIAENMTRNPGWRFLDIGRRMERAARLSELLLALFGEAQDDDSETSGLLFTLEASDSIITFRSRYLFAPVLSLVLDLLLLDETNPRSIAFQLAAVDGQLGALPQASQSGIQTEEQRMILELLTAVRLAKVSQLAQVGAGGSRVEFKALFLQIVNGLPKLSEAITRRYFNLTEDELRRVYSRNTAP
ncbi:MAG: circularly permuted type 2 ATP-grasp protein [Chitinophagales bacterium]|nr:circularly permuted type 2 ATP-grasp protein [Hyphomicrobiales bacterium]